MVQARHLSAQELQQDRPFPSRIPRLGPGAAAQRTVQVMLHRLESMRVEASLPRRSMAAAPLLAMDMDLVMSKPLERPQPGQAAPLDMDLAMSKPQESPQPGRPALLLDMDLDMSKPQELPRPGRAAPPDMDLAMSKLQKSPRAGRSQHRVLMAQVRLLALRRATVRPQEPTRAERSRQPQAGTAQALLELKQAMAKPLEYTRVERSHQGQARGAQVQPLSELSRAIRPEWHQESPIP
jgi:hypothetical protein